ncbi:MAG TPA: nicotinate-nucleotide--dimethylbenzimidazole phosphoribosyltransferase, partial [Actinomycetota bacterium]
MDDPIRELERALAGLPGPDEAARRAVADRAVRVLRPRGALAGLDALAVWLAGWRGAPPAVEAPACVVFAADHGVAAEGVSAYPPEVTRSMLAALKEGVATAPVLADQVGAAFSVADVGVGRPTGNLLVEPAMGQERFGEAIAAGRRAVAEADGCDLLVLGEMGIGNTTAAAAVAATLFGGPVEQWTGRGTGVDDETYARKVAVVDVARRRVGD